MSWKEKIEKNGEEVRKNNAERDEKEKSAAMGENLLNVPNYFRTLIFFFKFPNTIFKKSNYFNNFVAQFSKLTLG